MKSIYTWITVCGLILTQNGCGGGDDSAGVIAPQDSETNAIGRYNVSYISNDADRASIASSKNYTSVLVDNNIYFERKTTQNKSKKYSSDEAKNYCSTLDYSNGGWRLPNKAELDIAINIGSVLNFEETNYTFYQVSDGSIYSNWRCTADALSCGFMSAPSTNYAICARDLGATKETTLEDLTELDKMVVKISDTGEELADNSSVYSALLYKDPSLNIMMALERTAAGFTQKKTNADATSYCENLNYIGFSNWRLPSIEEAGVMAYYYNDNAEEMLKVDSDVYHWSSTSYDRYDFYIYRHNSNGSTHSDKTCAFVCVRSN